MAESGPLLPGGRKPAEKWERVIDRKIREAMEAGDFDNLPGTGKPLEIDFDPAEDPSWWMARRMLKSAGFSHPAIESKRAIEQDIAKGRATVTPAEADRWCEAMNRRIRDHNLTWPQAAMHIRPVGPADLI